MATLKFDVAACIREPRKPSERENLEAELALARKLGVRVSEADVVRLAALMRPARYEIDVVRGPGNLIERMTVTAVWEDGHREPMAA